MRHRGGRPAGQRDSRRAVPLRALLLAVALLAGCAGDDGTPPPADAPLVGYTRLPFTDPARQAWLGDGPRPLVTSLWYPAAPGSRMTLVAVPPKRPIFLGGHAARDAEAAAGGPRPLVLLSHGTGGSALQMMWLGRRLAGAGYLAAAVDHHGNTAAEPAYDARGFRMPWERARDLSVVLDRLLADPRWGPMIDRERISAVGFSLGGYAVAALAGAITDLDRYASFCAGPQRDATCRPQPEYAEAARDFAAMLDADPALRRQVEAHRQTWADPRIGRFAVLAPAPVQAFTDASLGAIDRPFLVIAGEADAIAPPATNAARLAQLVPRARYEALPAADHYVFLDPCNARGRRFVPVCRETGGIARDALHARVFALVRRHLEAPPAASGGDQHPRRAASDRPRPSQVSRVARVDPG